PTIPYPLWKLPIKIDARTHEDFLFHRASDPDQTENLWDSAPDQRDRMLRRLCLRMAEEGFPPEQLERLGLESVELEAAE
ncbi:MAG: hypothetical protein AAFX00_11535, partial [Pseudomonadota bacterium]